MSKEKKFKTNEVLGYITFFKSALDALRPPYMKFLVVLSVSGLLALFISREGTNPNLRYILFIILMILFGLFVMVIEYLQMTLDHARNDLEHQRIFLEEFKVALREEVMRRHEESKKDKGD